jgi:hypothetical protein
MPALKRRTICRYDLEDGGVVEIAVTGNIETGQALEFASTLLELKRKELGKTRPPALLKSTG